MFKHFNVKKEKYSIKMKELVYNVIHHNNITVLNLEANVKSKMM